MKKPGTIIFFLIFCTIAPNASAVLEQKNNEWFFTSSVPASITIPAEVFKGKSLYKISINNTVYTGKKIIQRARLLIAFELPAVTYSKIEFK